MRISIMDYGVGNLHSIAKGIEKADATVEVVSDPADLIDSECIVFPGVGAFGAAMEALRPVLPRLRRKIEGGTPTLGICLGMQILFERSEESPGSGLSVIKGSVKRLISGRVPHMGWNDVISGEDPVFRGTPKASQYYFANSYVCHPAEDVGRAYTDYGERFPSVVRKGSIYGLQFHPEKSGPAGLTLLKNFVTFAEGYR
jgi:glutamine amidotransferase